MFFIEWTYDNKALTFEAPTLDRAVEIKHQLGLDQNNNMPDIFSEEGQLI